jgi:2-polyprenyl-6-methoxyphenol hydroxylase-like FAD-dependent oxidoreductase
MSDAAIDCEVLIIGAGPVGLATALSLASQGVHVRIIDDMPVRHATPRASSIHARTLELLAPFGVSDRLVAYAQPIRQTLFFDVQGQEILRRQLRAIDSQYPAQQSLQQWHAEWMIAEQLLARGVDVQAATRCTDLVQNTEGIVVTVESDAGTSTLRCRYLVGADGARSTVRKLCDVRMVGEDYPERWIGGELVIEHTLSVDLELGGGELGGEGLKRGVADVGPGGGGRDAGGDHKALPEALGHGNGAEGGDLLAGVLFADD